MTEFLNSSLSHPANPGFQPSIPTPHRLGDALDSFLLKKALHASTPRLTRPVGVALARDYIEQKGARRLGWRALRKEVAYFLSGQRELQRQRIDPSWKRGIFLHFGAEQIGDSLMDLAPRSLLHQAGPRMDLFSSPSITELFQGDPWFGKVTCKPDDLICSQYDFAIVLSNRHSSLQPKSRYFGNLPWVSIHESFSGPDFDRAGYATQRLCDLLGTHLTRQDFEYHASQKMTASAATLEPPAASGADPFIAICVGGVDARRVYLKWDAVIDGLIARGHRNFKLIGSTNGVAAAKRLENQFRGAANLENHAGHTGIHQAQKLLANATAVACCDGGLMHVAATTLTPLVALFGNTIQPAWRLRGANLARAMSSTSSNVNDIDPQDVVRRLSFLTSTPSAFHA